MTDAIAPAPPALAGPLVVRSPNWLGDAVMALPAVRNLKSLLVGRSAHRRRAGKTRRALAGLSLRRPGHRARPAEEHPAPSPRNLREGKFASAVLLPNSLRAALEAWRAGIPQRIGYARGGRGLLLTRTVPVPARNPARLHQKFYYLDLAAAFGAPADASLPAACARSSADPPADGSARRPLSRRRVRPGQALAAGELRRGRQGARPKRGFKLVILGAPNDSRSPRNWPSSCPARATSPAKPRSPQFMAELAAAPRRQQRQRRDAPRLRARRPTVAIFGSTEPR